MYKCERVDLLERILQEVSKDFSGEVCQAKTRSHSLEALPVLGITLPVLRGTSSAELHLKDLELCEIYFQYNCGLKTRPIQRLPFMNSNSSCDLWYVIA